MKVIYLEDFRLSRQPAQREGMTFVQASHAAIARQLAKEASTPDFWEHVEADAQERERRFCGKEEGQ